MKQIIQKIISEKKSAVIGIDGCCASGKTTLANELAAEFGATVIHMDDFFLPPEMRTAERLSQAGGNVHYERFIEEVANGITSGRNYSYRVFSCKEGRFIKTVDVEAGKPIIIEGAYAFHPEIPDVFDLRIFLKTDRETQLKRILARNGADMLEVFKSKWIPLENRYFDAFDIENNCDVVINT